MRQPQGLQNLISNLWCYSIPDLILPPLDYFCHFFYSGRILFVDNGNQVTTWIDPRTGKSADGKTEEELGLLMESPPSPLSLMDVITVGSPVNIDSVISESSSSSIGKRNMP